MLKNSKSENSENSENSPKRTLKISTIKQINFQSFECTLIQDKLAYIVIYVTSFYIIPYCSNSEHITYFTVLEWSAESCDFTIWIPDILGVWYSGVWYSDGYCTFVFFQWKLNGWNASCGHQLVAKPLKFLLFSYSLRDISPFLPTPLSCLHPFLQPLFTHYCWINAPGEQTEVFIWSSSAITVTKHQWELASVSSRQVYMLGLIQ